jgi:hypothetical protein
MMPMTVPNSPRNGVVAPIVPSTHSGPRSDSTIRWRSRSTAARSASSELRPSRSNPISITSASGDLLR